MLSYFNDPYERNQNCLHCTSMAEVGKMEHALETGYISASL